MKKLNARGFSHDIVLILFVVIFAIAGVAYIVGSHADSVTPQGNWSKLGSISLPQQNETIIAYGCKYSTSNSNAVWDVQGLFTMSNSFKVANSWEASIANSSSKPYPGYTAVKGFVSDTTTPSVTLSTYVYSDVNNYLSFQYSSAASPNNVSGTIASDIHPGNLPTCSNKSILTPPSNLSTTNTSSTSTQLSWRPGTAAPGDTVAGAEVFTYRTSAGSGTATLYAKVPISPAAPSKVISDLSPNTSYGMYLKTYDASGNVSTPSSTVTVTTANNSYTNYLTVNTTAVSVTLNRDNNNYALMQHDQAGYTQGLIYGIGFTISNKSAVGFTVYPTQGTQGVGFYEGSGGMRAGQTVKIHAYINPNKPNGMYAGSAILKYQTPSGQWLDGPTISYKINLVDPTYTDYFSVKPTSITATLSRGKAQGGLVYGPPITLSGVKSTSFNFYNNEQTQGQGFYTSSGGLQAGQSLPVQTYLNANKTNGTYSGSAVIKYQNSQLQWVNGPIVSYSLTLIN